MAWLAWCGAEAEAEAAAGVAPFPVAPFCGIVGSLSAESVDIVSSKVGWVGWVGAKKTRRPMVSVLRGVCLLSSFFQPSPVQSPSRTPRSRVKEING